MRIWLAVPGPSHIASRQKSRELAGRVITRIICGAFLADIVVDSHTYPPISHWIVQRIGSPEIMHCAQELSFEEAETAAYDYLKLLGRKKKKAKAGE